MKLLQVHNKPPNDGFTHIDSPSCECEPRLEATATGVVWEHNSQDFTDIIDQAERIRMCACIMLQVELEQSGPLPPFKFHPFAQQSVDYPPACIIRK